MRPPLVLAYHGIGRLPRAHDPANLYVAPEVFTAQVRDLQRRGYRFLTVSELEARRQAGKDLAALCALTFDDGSVDNATVLPGLLEALGVPATLYVCPGLPGAPHHSLDPAAGVRLVTREEIAALAARPDVELGSHTNAHTELADATHAEALAEMRGSRAALEEIAGRPVRAFAYVRCAYSAACPDAAREAGYTTAVTCGMRGGWRPFELARVSLDALDNRLTWALKKRDLWRRAYASPPGRAARAVARPLRHAG